MALKNSIGKTVGTSVGALALALAVSGCGGDCIQIGGVGGCQSDTPPPPVPAVTEIELQGTAATGLAIAGGYVQARCREGYGAAITDAEGAFAVRVAAALPPCVLRVTNPADAASLHTVVSLEQVNGRAPFSISPLTEMGAGRVLAQTPGAFFATFDPYLAFQRIRPSSIMSAQDEVKEILNGIVNVEDLGDFMTTRLLPATATRPVGDAVDTAIESMRQKLTPSQVQTLVAALSAGEVTENVRRSALDFVTANTRFLIADAGADQSVVVGSNVTLDGLASRSSSDDPLIFAWEFLSRPPGSLAELSSKVSGRPSFTTDVVGTYVARLTVNNGKDPGQTDTVTIVARSSNVPPIANAGLSRTVPKGSVVTMDGSASFDANGDALKFLWVMSSRPVGSSAVLSGPTGVRPTFLADAAGIYTIRLVVSDDLGYSEESVVQIDAR